MGLSGNMPKNNIVTIVIEGKRCASKKNNRRNFGRISLPSKAYENFHALVGLDLIPWQGSITKPFRINIDYTIKGKYHQDLDNAVSSVLDVLKDYQVIPDDEFCLEIKAKKQQGKDWKIVICLEEI